MRQILLCLFVCLMGGQLFSQVVVAERTADFVPGDYSITGSATIREYDDGSITLTISDDFLTPQGPDVRVFLNDALNASSAIQVADLTDLNHFSGGLTVDVPEGTDLDANSNIVFYCFAFSQLWASGAFGDPIDPNPMSMDTCRESLTATINWITQVDICGNDGVADSVLIQNNIEVAPGESYAFLLTDTNEVLLEVVIDSFYNFEGRGDGVIRVYGLSYIGDLMPAVGEDRLETTATDCAVHSGGNLFLTVDMAAGCAVSNVNETLSAETLIYPNPVADQLTLELPANFTASKLDVIDLNGAVVLSAESTTTNKQTIDTRNLASGYYVLRVGGAQGVIAKRFVVQ